MLIYFASTVVFAQITSKLGPSKTDSLELAYFSKNKSIDDKIAVLAKLNAESNRLSDRVLQDLDLLIKKVDVDSQRFIIHYLKGVALYSKQKFDESEKSMDQAYRYRSASKDIETSLRMYQILGSIKNILGKNPEAKRLYLEGVQLGDKNNKPRYNAYLYINLGNLEADLERIDQADVFYQKAVDYSIKANDKRAHGNALMSLGISALHKMELQKAENLFVEAIKLLQNNKADQVNAKNNLGIVYEEMGNLQKANQIYLEVKSFFEEVQDWTGLANVQYDLGLLQQKMKNYKDAAFFCTESLSIYQETKDLYGQIQALKCLFQSAEKEKNYEKAYKYFQQYSASKDSLISEKKIEELTEIRKEFEFNTEKEKIAIQHGEAIKREKLFQKFLGLSILLLLGLLFFAYRAYILKSKSNKIITLQKQEIEKYSIINENLIFSLSHDIKEPMLGIQLLLSKLDPNDPYLKTMAESMNRQIGSINGIIDNLLKIKKTASSSATTEYVDLEQQKDVIQKLIQHLQYKLDEKHLHITQHIKPNIKLSLSISQQKLYLTLLNLMTNAIKHSPIGGEIQVIINEKGVYIRDFGDGIDPSILEKIGKEVLPGSESDDSHGMGLFLKSHFLENTGLRFSAQNLKDGGAQVGIITST